MNAEEMFEKLGYIKDKKARFGSIISYMKTDRDGYRMYDIAFYKHKVVGIDECTLTLELLQAINKQVEELGWFKDAENEKMRN